MRAIAVLAVILSASAFAERIAPSDTWPARSKPNTWVYDFGRQVMATTHIELPEETEGPVIVRHSEELMGNRLVRFNLRSGPRYHVEISELSGPIKSEPMSFRYLEVRSTNKPIAVHAELLGRPRPAHPGTLVSGSKQLDAIWDLAANGAYTAAQEQFAVDEHRMANTLDAWAVSQSHLLLTADRTTTRNTLEALPTQDDFNAHAVFYPDLLQRYLLQTGDRVTVERLATTTVMEVLDSLAAMESPQGLISIPLHTFEPEAYREDFDAESATEHPSLAANAAYLWALRSAVELLGYFDMESTEIETHATSLSAAIYEAYWDSASQLFNDTTTSDNRSYYTNIYAYFAGLFPPGEDDAFLEMVRTRKLDCSPFMATLLIEGCYRAGHPEIGFALLTLDERNSWTAMVEQGATSAMEAWHPRQHKRLRWSHPISTGPVSIITNHIIGLSPQAPGWTAVGFAPRIPEAMGAVEHVTRIPQGRIHIVYHPEHGYEITAPPGIAFDTELPEGMPIKIYGDLAMTGRPLRAEEIERLEEFNWFERTEGNRAVWVSVEDQMYRIIEGDEIVWETRCATATNGTGSQSGSMKTPLGWHRIFKKLGDDAPWGQVFRARAPTREVWKPGEDTTEDLVLTRVLLLDGEEPGKNKGGNVDSRARYIYVHGTNDEARIGQPSSHGCIRLRNDDVITAFNLIEEEALLLITEP